MDPPAVRPRLGGPPADPQGGRRGQPRHEPALEDAAHRLAAATLSGKAPRARRVRLVATTNLVLGVVISVSAIIALPSGADRFSVGVLLAEGAGFFALGRITWVYTVRRQREKAARALELNQPAAHRGA